MRPRLGISLLALAALLSAGAVLAGTHRQIPKLPSLTKLSHLVFTPPTPAQISAAAKTSGFAPITIPPTAVTPITLSPQSPFDFNTKDSISSTDIESWDPGDGWIELGRGLV